MPSVNIKIYRFTLVAEFFPPHYPRSNFFRNPKVWADNLLIRMQSLKLRNGLASVTNPKGKGQFDLVEWRVECRCSPGQKCVLCWGAVLATCVCTGEKGCYFLSAHFLTFPIIEMSF